MSTGPEELNLETIAPGDADLIDLRYEGVDLPLDENADPTQVELACGEYLGVVALEGGYDDESFVDLHVLGEVFRGESAYDAAVRNGFVGTLAEWLESLRGPESPNADEARAAQAAAEAAADRAEAASLGASASETSAEGHASAASTARSQAQAYTDEAGVHAQASLTFRTQAENASGQALAYRNQAAQSTINADSAALRAETAEGVSTTMRDQARGFSEASAGFSQSAESYMDESRVEAQAAREAHLLAETSRENSLAHSQAAYTSFQEALARSTEAGEYASAALTSRLAAEAARDDTDVAAAAVIIDRDIVIARADEAGEYAEAAESHRASALTSAGAASVSADNSAISETNAESSRVAAEAARDIAVASSGDAADALAATISYRDQAEIFSDSAGDSATAAATARVAAESARDTANGAASAAATSASSASSSQTAAASSASAASTSATNAATSAGAASTSATNASNSATTASGHAATASTQATNAANSATAAGGSATAASGSASSAATSATNAGNSATSANSSSVSAASSYTATRLTAANRLPFDFSQDGAMWFSGFSGAPTAVSPITADSVYSFPTVSGVGKVVQIATAGTNRDVSGIGTIPVVSGRTYRVTGDVRALSAIVGSPTCTLYFIGMDSTGAAVTTPDTSTPTLVANTWTKVTLDYTAAALIALNSTVTQVRVLLRANGASGSNTFQFREVRLEDVTDQLAAAASASAAATSASSASTSATNAGTSATAAATSATNASTSAGSAGTSATNAANSATTATTQANNASTSASTAATHATNAGNSASAAGTSATTAGTHATNAGNSATAASASAVSAASSFTNTVLVDGNQDFSNGFTGWYNAGGTTPTATASLGGRTNVLSLAAGVAGHWRSTKRFPVDTTRKYKISTEVYAGAGSGSTQMYVGFAAFDASGAALTHSPGSYAYCAIVGETFAANSGWHRRDSLTGQSAPITGEGTGTWAIFPVGTRSIELLALQNYNNGACVNAINFIRLEDITETQAALSSATAAATSASSASTSAGAAGVSATSAATQATNAGVSAGNAASSASTAATQASNASTSAASASSSAVTAANLSGSTANILRRSQFFTGNAVSDFAPWTSGNNTLGATAGVYNYSTSWAPAGEFNLFTEAPNVPGAIHDWYTDVMPAEALKYYCLSAYAGIFNASSAGDVRVFIEFLNSAGAAIGYSGAPAAAHCYSSDGKAGGVSLDNFKRIFVIAQAPAATTGIRAYIRRTNMGTTSYTWVLRPMLSEASATMTAPPPFGPSNIASSVAVTQTAVASLNAQNTLARYEVVADTGGGTARLRLVSSTYGTRILLDADYIKFGDNTTFDNAVDVLVTTTGSNARIIAWGAAFGTDGQLTEWEGPSSVTWGNHSRANAYFYRANVAPYVGGSALASGFSVSQSHMSRLGTRMGAGSVTTSVVTLTPSGHTGTVSYTWTNVFGDSSLGPTAGTSAATAFNGSVAANQQKQAQFAWTATDSGTGKTVSGYCSATILDVS